MLNGRVLITGGSGFLGRGIMRRAKRENWPCEITVYSRDEYKQALCKKIYPDARYVLGDVQDEHRLFTTMIGHDLVIHAAAIKYVPEAEFNVFEAVNVNILGASSTIKAAIRAGVKEVIGISTDKAVRPVNMYGMSKAILERLFAEASNNWGPKFNCVRYGNVVGSTGSVIPLFQDQFFSAGKVKITDPNMTRFWMSIDDAVNVILEALNAPAGCIVIPRPKSMSIGNLAHCIAGEHFEIIGSRPGEKIHEELMHYEESVRVFDRKRSDYHYLLSSMDKQYSHDPFNISSQYPPAGWVTPEQMQAWIGDALNV